MKTNLKGFWLKHRSGSLYVLLHADKAKKKKKPREKRTKKLLGGFSIRSTSI